MIVVSWSTHIDSLWTMARRWWNPRAE